MQLKNLTLITGGARSGKSSWAERLALEAQHPVSYIATMDLSECDQELALRIARHQGRRPDGWQTLEAPRDLSSVVSQLAPGPGFAIVDCLSLFVSNHLLDTWRQIEETEGIRQQILARTSEVLEAIKRRQDIEFVIVSNEVGSGIVPENALSRAYRDILGEANQLVAALAGSAFLCCAGLRVRLKP